MKKLAIKLNLEDDILFLGNKDQNWIANAIAKASVVVSPLTGRALAEVALGAAPVVAYDLDWHSEIIKNKKTGILVPAYNYHEMALGIEKLLLNRKEALEMGNNLRKLTLQLLNPDLADKNQRIIFNNLLN